MTDKLLLYHKVGRPAFIDGKHIITCICGYSVTDVSADITRQQLEEHIITMSHSMTQQRWLVCGGRTFGHLPPDLKLFDPTLYAIRFKQLEFLHNTLTRLAMERSKAYKADDNWLPEDIKIISGGATGADDAAQQWACVMWTDYQVFPAQWDKYGNRAGAIRNQQMIDKGEPTLGIAFPGGTGTADMITRLRKHKIETLIVEYKPT